MKASVETPKPTLKQVMQTDAEDDSAELERAIRSVAPILHADELSRWGDAGILDAATRTKIWRDRNG